MSDQTINIETTTMASTTTNNTFHDKDAGDDYISVPEFYNGRSIFITGGTGFMGKVSYQLFSSFGEN